MIPLNFSVALGIVKTSAHMLHAAQANEVLEVFRNELGAVVRDDPWLGIWELLPSCLRDDLDVDHRSEMHQQFSENCDCHIAENLVLK